MPTIRIDDEVYSWLQSQATPFEDTPNAVLRRTIDRITELEARPCCSQPETAPDSPRFSPTEPLTAKVLIERWRVPVIQGRYHQGGTFFVNLTEFPGALFDPNGYVVFETEDEYRNCDGVNVGDKRTNVSNPGIRALPQYKRVA